MGEALTVGVGRKLQAGDRAPDFALEHFDGEHTRAVRLDDSNAQVRLISTINALDTPVGDVETAARMASGRISQ